MSKLTKLGIVIGGYILACLAPGGVVYVYELFTQNAVAQASSGMYAFSDMILFMVTLGFLMLFPTGLALYFLVIGIRKRYLENLNEGRNTTA